MWIEWCSRLLQPVRSSSACPILHVSSHDIAAWVSLMHKTPNRHIQRMLFTFIAWPTFVYTRITHSRQCCNVYIRSDFCVKFHQDYMFVQRVPPIKLYHTFGRRPTLFADTSPMPLIFTRGGGQKCEIWPRLLTTVDSEPPSFRNGVRYLKSIWIWCASMIGVGLCPPQIWCWSVLDYTNEYTRSDQWLNPTNSHHVRNSVPHAYNSLHVTTMINDQPRNGVE